MQSSKTEASDDFIKICSKNFTTIWCPLDEKKNQFGILLSCVAPKQTLQNQGINVGAIFSAILQLDPDATFLPLDNDTTRVAKLNTLLRPTHDFKTMMDWLWNHH